MNEGNESFPSTATRKKRRYSGLRYSSKKALEHSRESRRTIIVGGLEFTSVTRALSYPSAQTNGTCFSNHHVFATGSSRSHLLESVEEIHEEWKQLSIGNANFDGDNIQKVRNIKFIFQS
jgi:hypothetical protein